MKSSPINGAPGGTPKPSAMAWTDAVGARITNTADHLRGTPQGVTPPGCAERLVRHPSEPSLQKVTTPYRTSWRSGRCFGLGPLAGID
jgi:hypothetical protein